MNKEILLNPEKFGLKSLRADRAQPAMVRDQLWGLKFICLDDIGLVSNG